MKIIEIDGKQLILYDFPNFFNKNKEIGNSLDDFEILRILDDSKYSKVFKVKSKKNFSVYAMKRISLTLLQENNLFPEIDFFKAAEHPNIIKYFKSFYDNDYIYIIMEFMNNYDLEKYNKLSSSFETNIPEEKIFKMSYKCLSALDYIHNANRKRQIHLKHIFIDDNFNIKINILSLSSIINYDKEKKDIHILGNSLNQLYHNESSYNEGIKYSLYSFLEFIENDKIANSYNGKIRAKELFIKYCVKITSLKAIFNCLNSYKNIRTFFSDKYVIDFICEDSNNKIKPYSKQILNIFEKLNTENIAEEEMNTCFYELRNILEKEGFNSKENMEISPENLLPFILIKLNTELNEISLIKDREVEKIDSEKNREFKILSRGKKFFFEEEGIEKSTFEEIFNAYNGKISSLITRNFISYIKKIYKCNECNQGIIKFSRINFLWIPLGNKDYVNNFFNNNDGFISFENSMIKKCQGCKSTSKHQEYKYFYKAAKNLIVVLDRGINYRNEDFVDFKDILKLKNGYDNKKVRYKLKGIISKIHKSDEYIYYLIDENNNSSIHNNSKIKQTALILFYELEINSTPKNQPLEKPKTEFNTFKVTIPDDVTMLQRVNSDLSHAINNNVSNNINNSIYLQCNTIVSNHSNLENRLQNNNSGISFEMNNNAQFHLNNNTNNNINQFNGDMFGDTNRMRSLRDNYLTTIHPQNNLNNGMQQNFELITNYANNLNYNTEINKSHPNNIGLLNRNSILNNEFEIPEYFDRKENTQDNKNTGFIKGKKIEYPKETIGLL